jgi:hypothetical protein
MVAYMIFKDLGHQAIHSLAHIGEQHQDAGAIVSGGQRAFNGVNLPPNPFDASNQLLPFFVQFIHFPP